MYLGTQLANEDVSGADVLSSIPLDTPSLTVTVPTVF
jgi:hypothetical protein